MANSIKHKIRSQRSSRNYKAFDMFARNAEVTQMKHSKFKIVKTETATE